jgi:hypothetical protein
VGDFLARVLDEVHHRLKPGPVDALLLLARQLLLSEKSAKKNKQTNKKKKRSNKRTKPQQCAQTAKTKTINVEIPPYLTINVEIPPYLTINVEIPPYLTHQLSAFQVASTLRGPQQAVDLSG